MENFNIGHLNIGETSGFNFVSPWGDNSDRILKILKTLSLQPVPSNGQQFPVDAEYHWEGHLTVFKDRMLCEQISTTMSQPSDVTVNTGARLDESENNEESWGIGLAVPEAFLNQKS